LKPRSQSTWTIDIVALTSQLTGRFSILFFSVETRA
jgi:hypothetical protein